MPEYSFHILMVDSCFNFLTMDNGDILGTDEIIICI